MDIFKYGKVELDYLKSKDEKLGAIIDKIGMIEREVTPDLFTALVDCIVSQQISSKAAITVCSRLRERFGEICPETISGAAIDDIQKCGLSMRKASYIKLLGDSVTGNELDLSELHKLPNDEIIDRLISLKGIGKWTAEMLLIFSLERPDIVSYNDLAIQRGMMNLYGLKELTNEQFETFRKRYSPYGSVASLYLWEIS